MPSRHSSPLCVAALLAALQFVPSLALAATPDAYDPWPGLVQDIFSNRPMNDGEGVIAIEMPIRAEDAAIVPVTLQVKLSPGHPPPRQDDYAGNRSKPGAHGGAL